MRVDVLEDIITEDERLELKEFVLSNLDQFHDGLHQSSLRIKTRVSNRLSGDKIKYPPLVYTIQKRIQETLPNHEIEQFHGKDGLVVSVTYDSGDVYAHIDPRSSPTLHTLRCNILVNSPESGGEIYVGGKEFELKERSMMKYLVTKHHHFVKKVIGKEPRILFMYGFLIEEHDWE